ncbi:MAG: carboxypeptidase-like regulatory domain-containing protein, partial [Saprospiraceae bacterium]|nr:carboxypeptidase-like regulatory domain-containing protein [Saprospiraceae bacterium]
MEKQLLLIITFLITLSGFRLAAQQTVMGTVTDEDGVPLIGVTILEEGTTNGVVTDIDGRYSIEVSGPEAVLTFSYVGLVSNRQVVGARTAIDVLMEEDAALLDEVVVTALGFQAKGDEIGYASSTV